MLKELSLRVEAESRPLARMVVAMMATALVTTACASGDGREAEGEIEGGDATQTSTALGSDALGVDSAQGATDANDVSIADTEGDTAESTAVVSGEDTADAGGDTAQDAAEDAVQACADVIDASADGNDGIYRFSATVRSGDTGWDKYADAWEVRTTDGVVLGTRELAHPHETEQPFTRSLSGVAIPGGTAEVVVAARDSVNGFCGAEFILALEE